MVHFNGTEAQPANQPELQQPASQAAAIRLLATLGLRRSRLKVTIGIRMLCAPVRHRECIDLEVPAPQALDTKVRSANRGNPTTGRAVHQTENLRLLTKLKFKVQPQKDNSVPSSSAFNGAFQWH